jgi:tyrosinase
MHDRKNQKNMQPDEWAKFIDAVNNLHGVQAAPPAYRDFVAIHARAMNPLDQEAMTCGVHSMGPMMPGTNFLPWHRWFVHQMENRLRQIHPDVAIPYWDAITDRNIPAALDTPALKHVWGVTRHWKATKLAHKGDLDAAMAMVTFTSFQRAIEGVVHGSVHNAVGGQMATGSSPADPLFWLHHANIDRLWSEWQAKPAHARENPPNQTDELKPAPIFGVPVSRVNTIAGLDYRYV